MVDFVLNDLRRPAGERLDARLELLILPLHLNGLVALRFPRAGQGQAALLRVIGRGFFDDCGIEHDHVITIVVERNNALVDADHIRRHAHAAILVRGQRIQQVLPPLRFSYYSREMGKAQLVFWSADNERQA